MFPFWGFESFVSHLFLLHVLAFGSVEYQRIAFRKQILKKKIMTLVVACLFYYRSIPGSTTVFLLSKKMNLIIIIKYLIFLKFNTKHIEFEDF